MNATIVRADVDANAIVVHVCGDDSFGKLVYSSQMLRPLTEIAARAPHLVQFFEVFLTLYSADRLVKRRKQWQRHLAIEFPVTQVEAWRQMTPTLQQLVYQSTGDDVQFNFVERAAPHSHVDERSICFELEEPRPTSVVLLSDGLDSLCGALDHLDTHPEERVCFVSLVTNSRKMERIKHIRYHLRTLRPRDVSFCSSRLNLSDPPRASAQERTQRSRTMLAIAAGLAVAACYGTDDLTVSENGMGILNLPVPSLQMDHHSSQVLHPTNREPWHKLSEGLLRFAGRLQYPNRFHTKAEMCAEIPDSACKLIRHTSSCDSPDRYDKEEACGRCGSCIVRQRALATAGLAAFDGGYSSRRPSAKEGRFDSREVQLYHARELQRRLAEPDPWAALVTCQPTLGTTVLFEGEDPTHVRLETISLLKRHIHEVLSLEGTLRAG